MTRSYLTLGKLMVLLLSIISPVLLFQGYANQRELVTSRAELLASLGSQRQGIIADLIINYFTAEDRLVNALLKRDLPKGTIHGAPAFPSKEHLYKSGFPKQFEALKAPQNLLTLLNDDGAFPSGLPRRYAGFVELCRQDDLQLTHPYYHRFYQVAREFWHGTDLDDDTFSFLLAKLPEHIALQFQAQRQLLGLSEPHSLQALVRFNNENQLYLIQADESDLALINRRLETLAQGTTLKAGNAWNTYDNLQTNLVAVEQPIAQQLRRAALIYTATGLGVQLLLLLLYGVIRKYEIVNRTQKQLLATTTHELRTPLAVILQFAEMLIDRQDKVPPRLQTYHRYIHRECIKMQFLVENLLSAARFENLKIEPQYETIPLQTWLEDMVTSVSELGEHQIHLDATPLKVNWDRQLMNRVLTNLMENARIHAGTDVEVKSRQEGESVYLHVRDFGETPDLKALSQIKAFGGSRQPKGLGLGLYLVDRIIKLHQGQLRFEDAEPGLRVVLEIPINPSQHTRR